MESPPALAERQNLANSDLIDFLGVFRFCGEYNQKIIGRELCAVFQNSHFSKNIVPFTWLEIILEFISNISS
jgi:hypothetical protein